MNFYEMVRMMSDELVKGQNAIKKEFGRDAFKMLHTVKRNRKTFVVEAELKTGEVVRRTIKY